MIWLYLGVSTEPCNRTRLDTIWKTIHNYVKNYHGHKIWFQIDLKHLTQKSNQWPEWTSNPKSNQWHEWTLLIISLQFLSFLSTNHLGNNAKSFMQQRFIVSVLLSGSHLKWGFHLGELDLWNRTLVNDKTN